MDVQGRTSVSESVFQSLAEIALKDIENIVSSTKKGPFSGFTRIFERYLPQVTVRREDMHEDGFGEVAYELKLAVVYGVNIPEMAEKIREKIVEVVEGITGYKVKQVDIVVDRIVEPRELENEAPAAQNGAKKPEGV
ncbi:MAG: Asp23/Gls24 family envelope stress response protein [Firmicutes bacterium]|mgnify:CR=1 FL=1|nr:Asp23/Gls24 family envelope stress response protein [Bacillota bacterium]